MRRVLVKMIVLIVLLSQLVTSGKRIGVLAAERGISLSLGGASWPDDCREPRLLLAAADEHLYRAKHAGRDRVCGPDSGTPNTNPDTLLRVA